MAGRRSPEFRAIYSQAQSFAFSGTEIVVTFLRAEPMMDENGTQYAENGPVFVEEATVYLPMHQARDLCEKVLRLIAQQAQRRENSADWDRGMPLHVFGARGGRSSIGVNACRRGRARARDDFGNVATGQRRDGAPLND